MIGGVMMMMIDDTDLTILSTPPSTTNPNLNPTPNPKKKIEKSGKSSAVWTSFKEYRKACWASRSIWSPSQEHRRYVRAVEILKIIMITNDGKKDHEDRD